MKWEPRFRFLPRFVCHGTRRHIALAFWSRQNTQYVDDKSNWVCCCDKCFEEIQDYWSDRWSEYYSGL